MPILQKAMTVLVNAVWVDPESKQNLALLAKNTALLQQEPAEAAGGGVAAQDSANNDNLAAFEGLKGKAEESLEEATHECTATSEAWATRQSEATAEQAAIGKAQEILSSRVTVLIQVKAADDDLQETVKTQKVRQTLVNHFRSLGNRLHSLAMLNLVSVATQDPMENVKNLLKDLIAKLEKEAAEAETLHKFCGEEKKKTKEAMDKKNMEIEKLSTRIEKASTTKQELEEMIAETTEEIASTQKTNAEATKLRNE